MNFLVFQAEFWDELYPFCSFHNIYAVYRSVNAGCQS